MLADDLQRFLDPAALGDDVLDHQDGLVWLDLESATKHQSALLLFGKDEAHSQLTGDFLANDQSTHGWSDDGGGVPTPDLCGERCPESFDDGHLLEGEGALEELSTVKAAAKDEVSLQQGAGFSEEIERFGIRH